MEFLPEAGTERAIVNGASNMQEITFIGTYTHTAQDFQDTAWALSEGRLGTAAWQETRDLDDGPATLRDLSAVRVDASKIILRLNRRGE